MISKEQKNSYMKQWYSKNKEKVLKKLKDFRENNPEIIKERKRIYRSRLEVRLRLNEKAREVYKIKIFQCRANTKRWQQEHRKSWEGFIPVETNCGICGVKIFYNKGNQKESIHFDHRSNGQEEIKGLPCNWLTSHECSDKNKEIWKRSNFGYLCGKCNRYLPTKNRVEWLKNVIKYMGEEAKALVSPSSLPTP